MPYHLSETERILRIDWFGVLSLEDLKCVRDDIRKHMMGNRKLACTLHVFSEVAEVSFQPIDAYEHSLKLRAAKIPVRTKSASVAVSENSQNYARLFQELNRNPNLEMKVFPSEQEALAWLNS